MGFNNIKIEGITQGTTCVIHNTQITFNIISKDK